MSFINNNMRTQRQIKAKKREIVMNTALYVGYCNDVFNLLPGYTLIPVIKEFAEIISNMKNDKEIENMIITECVRNMNYQDFKEIESYFFNSI